MKVNEDMEKIFRNMYKMIGVEMKILVFEVEFMQVVVSVNIFRRFVGFRNRLILGIEGKN